MLLAVCYIRFIMMTLDCVGVFEIVSEGILLVLLIDDTIFVFFCAVSLWIWTVAFEAAAIRATYHTQVG